MFDDYDEDNICAATDADNDEEDANKGDQILMMSTTCNDDADGDDVL